MLKASSFIDKVEQLKSGIDVSLVEDPLVRLKEKMKNNKTTLEFKTITGKQLTKHLKKLNPKKSSGLDGLSQEHSGKAQLIDPLIGNCESVHIGRGVPGGLERGDGHTGAKKRKFSTNKELQTCQLPASCLQGTQNCSVQSTVRLHGAQQPALFLSIFPIFQT